MLGPSSEGCKPCYYAGHPLYSEEGQEIALYSAVIDLQYADDGALPIFKTNPLTGEPDYIPRVYERMMEEVQAQQRWKDMSIIG